MTYSFEVPREESWPVTTISAPGFNVPILSAFAKLLLAVERPRGVDVMATVHWGVPVIVEVVVEVKVWVRVAVKTGETV